MKKEDIGLFIISFIFIIIVLAFVGIQMYCWIKYGNKPIQETPNWVNWLMYRGGNK